MEQLLRDNHRLWELFGVIRLLDSEEECARFFRDLLTIKELEAMAERWQIARLIDEGMPYRKISESTGASTTTVTRIAHWLKYGEGGYRLMLDRSRNRKRGTP
jgi:TrpR-related protein YerC/YecD